MNEKYTILGAATILVVAAVLGVLLINQPQNNGNGDYSFDGEWVLSYYETANLVDDNNKPIMDAINVPIDSRTINPKDRFMPFTIDYKGESFFTGKIGNMEVEGTTEVVSGGSESFKFSFQKIVMEEPACIYIFKGIFKGDRICLSAIEYDISGEGQIRRATYALYIPADSDPMDPKVDWMDYNLPYDHVSTKVHKVTDFTDESGDMSGQRIDSELKYVKSYTMINIYEITSERGKGVMTLTSLGAYPSENAWGAMGGNFQVQSGKYIPLSGDSNMEDCRFEVVQNLHANNTIDYVKFVYNVPYYHGSLPSPADIQKHYEGKVIVINKDGTYEEHSIEKVLFTFNDTLYVQERIGEDVYDWFGEIYGQYILLHVNSNKMTGYIEGSIFENGDIVLSGLLYKKDGTIQAYKYELSPSSE